LARAVEQRNVAKMQKKNKAEHDLWSEVKRASPDCPNRHDADGSRKFCRL